MDYVNSREAMKLLGIKSMTTLGNYDKALKPTTPFGNNRRRYNVKSIEKFLRGNGLKIKLSLHSFFLFMT